MASPEMELEDRIKEVGSRLVSPPSAVEELLPLLDQIESLLSRVEQSPSQSMSAALRPAMNALISKEFLEHSDTNVKVAVASCISEITRITAPDAPYDDDLMKVIFRIIVEGFGRLDDIHSRSYSKRISILETVAKVRSCVVMLDLECDELILEMFQHFLKTIRSDHPENVFTSMETIMTLVLEESEDISSELLSSLLDSVKKDKEVLPVARRLGEKVIGNCAVKLKPYLMEVVQSLCAREYSKIVASICQENSDALEHTEINVSGDILADDSKLSERTVSDELPEGSVKQEQEVGSLEKVGTDDKSPRSMMSNGVVQTGDVDSVVEPTSPKQKPERSRRSGQSTNNLASDGPNVDGLEPMSLKSDSMVDVKTKKTRGRKSTSSVLLSNTVDHIQNDSDKEATPLSSRTDRSNEVDNSQIDGPSGKEAESAMPLEPEGKNDTLLAHRSDNGAEAISSPSPSKPVLEADRPKRGRPPGLKVSAKKGVNVTADQPASPSSEKGSQPKDEQLPSADNDSKKDHGDISNVEAKSSRCPGKKVHAENVVDAVASVSLTSDSEGKSSRRLGKKMKAEIVDDTAALVSVMSSSEGKQGSKNGKKGRRKKVTGGELSGEQQKSDVKQLKKNASLGKYVAGELSSQDVPSTPKSGRSTQSKDQNDLDDSIKTQSRKKRGRGTDKMSKAPSSQNKEAENIVGSGIKIWWPDDQKFYGGKVVSFDAHSGKHKIIYDDGDEEILCLGDERYHLVDETKEDQAADIPSSIGIPEVQVNKKAKTSSDPVPTPALMEVTPMKSSTESGGERVAKRKGRPKGRKGRRSLNLSDGSTKSSGIKSNEDPIMSKAKEKDETPKSVGRPRGSTNKKSKKKRLSQAGSMPKKETSPEISASKKSKKETTPEISASKKSKKETSSEASGNKKPKTDNASSSEAAANRKPKKDTLSEMKDDDDTCSPRNKEAAAPHPKSGKRSRDDDTSASKAIKKLKDGGKSVETEDPAESKEDSPPKIARRRRKQSKGGNGITSEKGKEEKAMDVETEKPIDIETTPAAKAQQESTGKRKRMGRGRGRWARK